MSDVAFQQKVRFIEEHGLVVWRFHDHLHRRQQDMFAVTDLSFAGLKGRCSARLRYAGSIHIVFSQRVARREPLLESGNQDRLDRDHRANHCSQTQQGDHASRGDRQRPEGRPGQAASNPVHQPG